MPRCSEKKINKYAGGEMEGRDLADFETHLKGCPGCLRKAGTLKEALALVRAEGEKAEPVPESLWRKASLAKARRVPARLYGFAAAAALTAAAVVFFAAGEPGHRTLMDYAASQLESLYGEITVPDAEADDHTVTDLFLRGEL